MQLLSLPGEAQVGDGKEWILHGWRGDVRIRPMAHLVWPRLDRSGTSAGQDSHSEDIVYISL